MRISYQYKVFPGSEKFTRKSQRIGYVTGTPGMILIGMLLLVVIGAVGSSVGHMGNAGSWIMILLFVAAMVGVHYGLKKYREDTYRKMTEQYLQELEKLRYRDPAKYAEIVAQLKNG